MAHKRTRTGCLTCRRAGYKCDEERPFCRRCVRLGKTCPGYGLQLRWRQANSTPASRPAQSQAVIQPRNASKEADAASPAPRPPQHRQSVQRTTRRRIPSHGWSPTINRLDYIPSNTSITDRRLLHHWLTVLATVVSMADGPASNPYLTHLTPLIVASPALRSATLSMAALHLSFLGGQEGRSMELVSRRHRLAAISSLRLTVDTSEAETSLATILMLQLADRLFTGADDSPADHLVGARAVIQRHPGRWSTSSVGSFLLGVYLYQDVLASVSKGTSPLSDHESGIVVEGMSSLGRLTAVVRVVGHISRMRCMDGDAMLDYGASLQEVLNSLEDPDPCSDDVGQTVEAYRHAAFIYLYRVAHNIGAPHPLALRHVDACLQCVSRVPTSSTTLSAHVWPLWTAGCESIDPSHREFVRSRLDEMHQLRKLPSLKRVRCDIEEVWSVKDAQRASTGTDKIDCIKAIWKNRQRTADII